MAKKTNTETTTTDERQALLNAEQARPEYGTPEYDGGPNAITLTLEGVARCEQLRDHFGKLDAFIDSRVTQQSPQRDDAHQALAVALSLALTAVEADANFHVPVSA